MLVEADNWMVSACRNRWPSRCLEEEQEEAAEEAGYEYLVADLVLDRVLVEVDLHH